MSKISFVLGFALPLLISSLAFAEDNIPKFECTLSDTVSGDEIGDAKDAFTKDTAKIYLYCDSSDIKKGQVIKGEWIATDTNNVAPANYKIDEVSLTVPDEFTSGQTFSAKFYVSKPNAGWPVGQYQVNLFVDGQPNQSAKFNIN